MLLPTKANEDGSYTCIFLAGPWIEGVESWILPWLKEAYSEEDAQEYLQMFSENLMKPQVGHMFAQGKGLRQSSGVLNRENCRVAENKE